LEAPLSKRTLTLRSETLAVLTSDELTAVAGAKPTDTIKCLTDNSVLICRTVSHWETCTS
jgi:hypothetical protein